jgi:pyrimidine oxygenase
MSDCRLEAPPKTPIPLVVAGGSDAGLAFAARHCDYNFCAAPDTINKPAAVAAPVGRLMDFATKAGRRVKALVWVTIIADDTDAAAMARWETYKAGTDLVALDWARKQASADATNDDPNSTKSRRLPPEPTPTTSMKLIGSYETVAHLLREIASTPGLTGVMLSFDDFREGIEMFGERVVPRIE